MPEFHYVAIEPSGGLARGSMQAPDVDHVVARLRRAGNIPVSATPASRGSALAQLLQTEIGRGRALSRQDLTEALRELATMLGAGQDLDRALRFLVETAARTRVRAVFGRVRDAVRDGGTVATAMAAEPRSFPRLLIGMVRAAEAGGALAPTLERLAVLFERERSLVATVRSAMIYPALLLITAAGSVTLLLTRVLPQFVPLFEQNGVPLPPSTRVLIDAGTLLSAYGPYALAVALLLGMAGREVLRRPGPRGVSDALLLRLPVAGGLLRETMAARFTRTLGTLLVNGVPLLAALGIVRDTVGNLAGIAAIDRASTSVRDGGGLAAPLGASGVFPVRTVSLLRLGEETAQLGPTALRAAEIHEERVRLGVQRLVALLVPVITIAMGMMVAGIVGSLLQAMLGLNDLAH